MANSDGYNLQKQKLCGGTSVIFESVKRSNTKRFENHRLCHIACLKNWNMSRFVGQHLVFELLKWSVCTPFPGSSHTSATEGSPCGRRGLWDAGFTLTLASLTLVPDPLYPACSTLWVSRLQRNQLRHPLCFCGDLGSMKTFSPAVFFIPASSDSFKFAIWNYFLKVKVRSFFKGRHEGASLVAWW